MRTFIQALELSLSDKELKSNISKKKLMSLSGGILQAYTVAHEGKSKPKVLGKGQEILRWPRVVIQALAEKIKIGTKFFIGHGVTNDHANRETVGEIVASFVKEIGGRLSNVIVGHFPDSNKVTEMDVCSMEADIHTQGDIVGDINGVSGIALGNSDRESPAFPGARRLNMVQCFEIQADQNNPGDGKTMPITFAEVKQAVQDMNIFPHQLFTAEVMKNDKEFGKLYTDQSKLAADNERLTTELKETKATSEEAVKKSKASDVVKMLADGLKEGVTPRQKSFIENDFSPDRLDSMDDAGVKTFIDGSKKRYADVAKLFGEKPDDENANKGQNDTGKKDDSTGEPVDDALELLMKE